MNMAEEKKSMQEVMKEIGKKYENMSFQLAEDSVFADVEPFPTGCFSLDRVFGCGGMPLGRIIEIHGMESSGKSTLALYLVAQIQKAGEKAMFVDAEHSYSNSYAQKIGVDTEQLYLVTPSRGEEVFTVLEEVIRTGEVRFIVVDSVAALLPSKEADSGIEKDNIALQARLLTRGLQRITGIAAFNRVTVLFINQLRSNVGVMYGPKESTPGGKALKFYASVRLRIGSKKIEGKNKETIGKTMTIKAVKNKVGIPDLEAEMDVYFGKGVDASGDLLDSGEIAGIVSRDGISYFFKGEKLGGGKDKAKQFLEEHPEVCAEIRRQLEEFYSINKENGKN